jgi:hypothetical protein
MCARIAVIMVPSKSSLSNKNLRRVDAVEMKLRKVGLEALRMIRGAPDLFQFSAA